MSEAKKITGTLAFNSLSRDHQKMLVELYEKQFAELTFNSLSRDHEGGVGQEMSERFTILSTPSLGITLLVLPVTENE